VFGWAAPRHFKEAAATITETKERMEGRKKKRKKEKKRKALQ